ncbi:cTAGE family protein [Arabidopsis thaliana]|uniref:CTAGE family protein n=1 Tax=Arabidopsis thaliana TaxID=3702 RepID=F4I9I9_ARATH|nr:cTAGE family protein [Arabidopsis thaliana]AEE32667.1 cTAGE family protein [Arabidopsis thaliana]|eukprot:NP_175554.2 cTAGE family protein [Arabidopsis thaliana]
MYLGLIRINPLISLNSVSGNVIDTQKQVLSLIRDFTLKDLVEISGFERFYYSIPGDTGELSLNDFTIQSLEARISLLQDEVSTNGIEDDALKRSVYKLNGRIDQGEKFHKTIDLSVGSDETTGITANNKAFVDGSGADSEAIKGMLSDSLSLLRYTVSRW